MRRGNLAYVALVLFSTKHCFVEGFAKATFLGISARHATLRWTKPESSFIHTAPTKNWASSLANPAENSFDDGTLNETKYFTETKTRSAVKTLVWRVFSSLVTMQTASVFTGNVKDGINLMLVSFLPKFSAMFVLDRLVNQSSAVRKTSSKVERSFLKVIAWTIFSMTINLTLATLLLKDLSVASKIYSVTFAIKTLLLFLYERLWNQIQWGKQNFGITLENISPEKISVESGRVDESTFLVSSDDRSTADAPDATETTTGIQKLAGDESFDWANQWFPLMPIEYLRGLDPIKPIPINILGRKLVIWKGSTAKDEWLVFEDICPHRRSPLSTGQVISGCLTCRYHGWQFDQTGKCAKVPMDDPSKADKAALEVRANAFQSRCAGGLLWAFLGTTSDCPVPDLSPETTPTNEEAAGADWMFNRNPISYVSMMENTFDPSHAPFTHESMTGFAGISFSPDDIVAMKEYKIRNQPSAQGFSLEHTPYQSSTAKVAGPDSLTIRSFVPPCTVAVVSPPFFKTKMWFVPANEYETNVLSFFPSPESRLEKYFRRFPRVKEIIKDTQHTLQYIGDWNYRFLTQDRITMQGQDERKVGKKLADMTTSTSDVGVATFQEWLKDVAGGGPFAKKSSSTLIGHNFSHELSFWESHGKYCPRCQRSMKRLEQLKQFATRWSSRFMASVVAVTILSGLSAFTSSRVAGFSIALSLNLLVMTFGLRLVVDWCRQKERRMHSIGADVWSPQKPIFGFQSSPNN